MDNSALDVEGSDIVSPQKIPSRAIASDFKQGRSSPANNLDCIGESRRCAGRNTETFTKAKRTIRIDIDPIFDRTESITVQPEDNGQGKGCNVYASCP